jgi:hypothetical protein
VVLALLGLTACDPTGNADLRAHLEPDAIDPLLVGSWVNQHLVPGSGGGYTRVITKYVFRVETTCARETKTFDLLEGIERTTLRNCAWVADGRVLSLTYEGYGDTVNYIYSFPTQHGDTLDIGGFRFGRAY